MLKRFGILGMVLAGLMMFQPAKASAQDYRYNRDGYAHRDYNGNRRHEEREWREREHREHERREWREHERWERPYYYGNGYQGSYYYAPAPNYYAPGAGVYFSWRNR